MKLKPKIETSRLILREFEIDDAEAVYEFGSNKEIHQYTGDHELQSLAEARSIIEEIYLEDYKKYGFGRWALIYKPDHKIIGFAGLKYLLEYQLVDLGFRFLPAYWRKGIATEASLEIVKYGFNHYHLDQIIGIAMPDNIASCRVLEKVGLTLYKTDGYGGPGRVFNWYRISRQEYDDQRKTLSKS